MTNHWIDIGNTDCALIIGSNAAENHPMSFKWVAHAIDTRGAKLISVDPRFTRTSSKAHVYAPMRSGTDIAFINGMIKYVLDNELYLKEYVVEHTNASFIVKEGFGFKDGLFTGYDNKNRKYDKSSWQYELQEGSCYAKRDKTLKDPRCVFQLLKKYMARYDADTVCKITGTPKDVYLEVCKTYGATGKRDKAGTIMYAMGTTQHTVGTQNIRAYAIMQLLLGNMGVAGGGINALRGEPNVQGSTDHALLFHILPGYLQVPVETDKSLKAHLDRATPKACDEKSINYWQNYPKFMVSLMKAWYGDFAQKDNDFAFHYLPKIDAGANHSHMTIFEEMNDGKIKGAMFWGQNPVCGGPNSKLEAKALEKLDWMVAVDLWQTETSIFWKRPGVDPSKIKTEVFLLPAAASIEKEGSISNSGRWAQWRYKAIKPPGVAISDLDIITLLHEKLKELYKKEGGALPEAITKATWNYGEEPDPKIVAKEINGYDLASGKLLVNFTKCKDDGTTASGNWLYSGSCTEEGNMMQRRDNKDTSEIGSYHNWSWCWPINRRIIYNRASCDKDGNPWDPKRMVIKWDGTQWIGDVPDFGKTSPPSDEKGSFIMKPEGVACVFCSAAADGPFPEHYEPYESPVKNLMSSVEFNPATYVYKTAEKERGSADKYPIVGTSYRVTEHWQTGQMTRWLPWLCELMPEMFVEMSIALAEEKGIENGQKCKIVSARGEITAKAIVTDRFKPFKLNGGKMVHEIGLPWCFGYSGIATGDICNDLTSHIGDANTRIPEYKAFLCDIEKI